MPQPAGVFASPVLRELRALNGSVVIENVDAALTEPADTAVTPPGARKRRGEVAPVWEIVEARIRAGGVYPPGFFLLLIIAADMRLSAAYRSGSESGGSALQFLLNVVLLIAVGPAGSALFLAEQARAGEAGRKVALAG